MTELLCIGMYVLAGWGLMVVIGLILLNVVNMMLDNGDDDD